MSRTGGLLCSSLQQSWLGLFHCAELRTDKFWCYFLLMGTESNSDDESLVLAWSPASSMFLLDSFEGLARECKACSPAVLQYFHIVLLWSVFSWFPLYQTSSVGERWSFQVVFMQRLSKDVFITVLQERDLRPD